jgi:hypothetical protein
MSLDIQPTKFTLELRSEELENSRIPLCTLVYPSGGTEGPLDEEVISGRLGELHLSIDGRFNEFDLTPDSPQSIVVDNAINVEEIRVPVGPDEPFRPCVLDRDGDGVITKNDLDAIYGGEKAELRFDINGDGVVDGQDRLLAEEYLGTICDSVVDPDIGNPYPGVYDSVKLTWGHSINRLLKGSHSRKPLFRVVMPVNYFYSGPGYDFTNPNISGDSSTADLYFENNRLSPNSVIKNATLIFGYQGYNSQNSTLKGEILVKDIFWKGSEADVKQDVIDFYTQGKNIQEANGINPDENFYNDPLWKTYLNSVRVCTIYDQSGNEKHGYSTALGNSSSSYGQGQSAFPGHEDDTKIGFCPMIYSMGRFFENNNGRMSLSRTGYQPDDTNPYGFDEGSSGMNTQPFVGAGILFSMGNPGGADFQRQFCPSTLPGQPVYQYTVADFYIAYTRAPFGNFIEGSFNRIDVLRKSFEDAYNLSSFDDIFYDPQEGKLTDEILNFVTPTQHIYQYSRAMYALNAQTYNMNNVTVAGIYREPSGDSISLMESSYTVFQANQGNANDIINPELDAEGNSVWNNPAWKETYQNQFIPTEETAPQYTSPYGANAFAAGYRQGPTDLYLRLKSNLVPSDTGNYNDYNRRIGGNQWSQNLTLCLSTRYHTGTYPGLDLRLNNKRQIIYNDSPLTASPSFQQPRSCGAHGVRNLFYETVGFEFENEESYEQVLEDANAYFNCLPQEDSSRLLDPYTQEDLDAYNNG